MKLGELAQKLGCKVEGDPRTEIRGIAGIDAAQAGELTFISNPRYRQAARTTRASAVLIAPDLVGRARAGLAAARAVALGRSIPRFRARHRTVLCAAAICASDSSHGGDRPTAQIGEGAHIGPYCFVDEGAEIGRNAVLHSFVAIYRDARIGDDFFAHAHAVVREGCRIGDRVILQNGVVIGGDGFGFAKQPTAAGTRCCKPESP